MAARDHIQDEFPSTSLEVAMKLEVTHAARYEHQITALERSLSSELKKARENIALYKEKKALVEDHIRLAKQQEWNNVPTIMQAYDRTRDAVHGVEWKLPAVRSQLVEIRKVYEQGRRRAQMLQAEMEWKAKSDYEQWRSTLLGKSPLSPQQVKREWIKLLQRLLLAALASVLLLYIFWVILPRD